MHSKHLHEKLIIKQSGRKIMKVILMVWLQGLVSVSEQSILQLLIYLSLEQTKKTCPATNDNHTDVTCPVKDYLF